MTFARISLLSFAAAVVATAQSDAQSFVLQSDDYRFIDLNMPHVPVEVEASFQVANNAGTVHMELLPHRELGAMRRGSAHTALASTAEASSGTIRHIVQEAGPYRIVIKNRKGAKPVTVMWQVSTRLDPEATATVLSPRRRLVTILVSFALFFAMVGYSGWRLKRAIRE